MTTTTHTNTSTRLAFAATIAALCFGAAACGTEHEAAAKPSASRPQPPSSSDLIDAAKANQSVYLEQLRARHAAHGYGDDRRQSHSQPVRRRSATAHHRPGYDKALQAER